MLGEENPDSLGVAHLAGEVEWRGDSLLLLRLKFFDSQLFKRILGDVTSLDAVVWKLVEQVRALKLDGIGEAALELALNAVRLLEEAQRAVLVMPRHRSHHGAGLRPPAAEVWLHLAQQRLVILAGVLARDAVVELLVLDRGVAVIIATLFSRGVLDADI